MDRRSTSHWLRLPLLVTLLSLGASTQALAFFPPDPVPVPHVIVNPPLPPTDPFVKPPGPAITPPPTTCGCTCPHVHTTPEPVTLVSSLIGLSMLGAYGLRRRLRKK